MEVGAVSGGGSLTSAAGIEKLLTQMMSLERQPLTRLQTQKTDLKVKKAIYNDIKAKLEAVRTGVQSLTGGSGALNKYAVTLTDANVIGVTLDSSQASAARYSITVNTLAQAHSLASAQQSDSTSALGLAGDLTIQGQTITIDAGDSLSDIRTRVNDIDYPGAGVKAVVATIVDNKLVLTSAEPGTDAAITFTDDTNGGNGLGLSQVQAAQNASLTVNGVGVTRQRNTGLNDVVTGLTFDLKAEGSSQVTVAKDNADVVTRVKTLIGAVNDLASHLKLKTEPQLDATVTGKNPTYKPAPLGRDLNLRSLRFNLSSDLLGYYGGAASGAPRSLADLGITLGSDNRSFELSDESALTAELTDDFQGVADLLDHILGQVETRAARYLDGTDAIITATESGVDDEIELVNTRIATVEARLKQREESLRKQLYEFQAQLISMQYQYQSTQAAMYGSLGSTNQLL